MKPFLAFAFVLLAALPALADPAEDRERDRIRAERVLLDDRLAQAQKECRATFAVNDCVRRAQRAHNNAEADLRRQERVLNDVQRRRRAAERLKALDERNSPEERARAEQRRREAVQEQKEREARAAEKARRKAQDDASKAATPPRQPRVTSGLPPGPQGAPRAPGQPEQHGPSAEERAKNRAAYEARLKEAQEHNKELRERVAKRRKPAASDLPVPR